MSASRQRYSLWSYCDMCGYEGMVAYLCRDDEDYGDPQAEGMMFDSVCPACEHREYVLVTMEQFREMTRVERDGEPG